MAFVTTLHVLVTWASLAWIVRYRTASTTAPCTARARQMERVPATQRIMVRTVRYRI